MLKEIMDYLGIAGTNGIWVLVIVGIVVLQFIFAVINFVRSLFTSVDDTRVPRTYNHNGEYRTPEKYCPPAQPVVAQKEEVQTWTCPRCNQEIDVDPDDDETDFCPKCQGSLWDMTCPQCGKDIWADSPKCPECQTELKMSKCPNCGKRIFVTEYGDDCPYCEETLWICPRCQQYLNEDPDEVDECPECHQTLVTYTCPKCRHEDIFIDQQVCPGCCENLQFEACPECGKSIPSGLDECPYCDEGLTITVCSHCKKEHYLHE